MIKVDDLRFKIFYELIELEKTLLKKLQEQNHMRIKNNEYARKAVTTTTSKKHISTKKDDVETKEFKLEDIKRSLASITDMRNILLTKMPLK